MGLSQTFQALNTYPSRKFSSLKCNELRITIKIMFNELKSLDVYKQIELFQHSHSISELHFGLGWLRFVFLFFHFVFLGFSDAIPGTIPILATSCFCLVLMW